MLRGVSVLVLNKVRYMAFIYPVDKLRIKKTSKAKRPQRDYIYYTLFMLMVLNGPEP